MYLTQIADVTLSSPAQFPSDQIDGLVSDIALLDWSVNLRPETVVALRPGGLLVWEDTGLEHNARPGTLKAQRFGIIDCKGSHSSIYRTSASQNHAGMQQAALNRVSSPANSALLNMACCKDFQFQSSWYKRAIPY